MKIITQITYTKINTLIHRYDYETVNSKHIPVQIIHAVHKCSKQLNLSIISTLHMGKLAGNRLQCRKS